MQIEEPRHETVCQVFQLLPRSQPNSIVELPLLDRDLTGIETERVQEGVDVSDLWVVLHDFILVDSFGDVAKHALCLHDVLENFLADLPDEVLLLGHVGRDGEGG